MDKDSWLFGFSQDFISALLIFFLGALVMAWARRKEWRWAAPVLYALVTGASLYILLSGFWVGEAPLGLWSFGILLVCALGVVWYVDKRSQQRVPIPAPSSVPLKSNQIIFPNSSKNGVLWEWSPGRELAGPFCPIHRVRLWYWPTHGPRRAEIKEDDFLGSNASFVCLVDDEEFTFIRLSTMRVSELRAQAMDQFQVEHDRRKALEK
jgi:hypothetical protein